MDDEKFRDALKSTRKSVPLDVDVIFFYYNRVRDDFRTVETWEIEIISLTLTIIFSIITYSFVWNDFSFLFIVPLVVWIGLLIFFFNRAKLKSLALLLDYYEKLTNDILEKHKFNVEVGIGRYFISALRDSVVQYIHVPLLIIFTSITVISTYLSYVWISEMYGTIYGILIIMFTVFSLVSLYFSYRKFDGIVKRVSKRITKSYAKLRE